MDVWAFIRELQQEGATLLLTTQYLEEADQLADRIAVIDGGTVIAEGTSDELKDRIGGEVLFEDKLLTTIRVARDGQESWVELKHGYGGKEYYLTVIERQAMKQDVVGNAEAFRTGLAQSGHVEVPGILFDTGKADLKPESEAAIAEVAKLLKADPSLKVWVVGHTDNVGSASSNLTLSSARAATVVRALVQKHSIDASRLSAFGNGPYAPVATNGTDDGRAHNRRVELVAQ
jgi:outer membrane protein OmpA-like peptidoglycan-associated protein